jgi:antitoxin (DNA-binding transcriptional repressor) of toxin-antitoxin stability system
MIRVKLSEVKSQLSEYLRLAQTEVVIITRHGKPAGVPVGFTTEDDWFDYKLENDPRFLARVAAARKSLREGKEVRMDDLAGKVPSAWKDSQAW